MCIAEFSPLSPLALIPVILAKPDIATRLVEQQTLLRKTPVLGNDFVQVINQQIKT